MGKKFPVKTKVTEIEEVDEEQDEQEQHEFLEDDGGFEARLSPRREPPQEIHVHVNVTTPEPVHHHYHQSVNSPSELNTKGTRTDRFSGSGIDSDKEKVSSLLRSIGFYCEAGFLENCIEYKELCAVLGDADNPKRLMATMSFWNVALISLRRKPEEVPDNTNGLATEGVVDPNDEQANAKAASTSPVVVPELEAVDPAPELPPWYDEDQGVAAANMETYLKTLEGKVVRAKRKFHNPNAEPGDDGFVEGKFNGARVNTETQRMGYTIQRKVGNKTKATEVLPETVHETVEPT